MNVNNYYLFEIDLFCNVEDKQVTKLFTRPKNGFNNQKHAELYANATGAYFVGDTNASIEGYKRKYLTKEQAIEALKQGKKIRHISFLPDQWMCLNRNQANCIFEDGCVCSFDAFWSDRNLASWQDGWGIVELY